MSFSNLDIVNIVAIKKEKGNNFVIILTNVKEEYKKYTWNACPSSITRSRRFTAWTDQVIAAKAKITMVKYLINSLKKYV